jgi:hypothetical protein
VREEIQHATQRSLEEVHRQEELGHIEQREIEEHVHEELKRVTHTETLHNLG